MEIITIILSVLSLVLLVLVIIKAQKNTQFGDEPYFNEAIKILAKSNK